MHSNDKFDVKPLHHHGCIYRGGDCYYWLQLCWLFFKICIKNEVKKNLDIKIREFWRMYIPSTLQETFVQITPD